MRYEPHEWARGPVRGQPWTRREREPQREYGWFLRYLTRPARHRHPNHVATELNQPAAPVATAARAWRWSARARAFDHESARVTRARADAFAHAASALRFQRQFVQPAAERSGRRADTWAALASDAVREQFQHVSRTLADSEQRLEDR